MNKAEKSIFIYTLSIVLLIAVIGFKLYYTLSLQTEIKCSYDAAKVVKYNEIRMTKRQFEINYLLPAKLNSFNLFLFELNTSVVLAGVFILSGLLGGISSIWLRLAGIRKDNEVPLHLVVFISCFSGFLMYLLLLLPAPLLTQLFNLNFGATFDECERYEFLTATISLGILAGLFTSTFYNNIELFFQKLFKRG